MQKTEHAKFIVISALGKDRPGIVNQLTGPITEMGANIIDSRMSVLGGEFAVLMLVEGNWNTIAKLESALPGLQAPLDLTIQSRRTENVPQAGQGMSYAVNVVSLDHPGIVNQLAGFFSSRNINIQDLETDSYRAAHTGTKMFTANITITLPPDTHIARLREEFLDFCDELNLDAVLEPLKG